MEVLGVYYIMSDTKTTSDLRQQLDEVTKTLDRVVSVITGNLSVDLDSAGELSMTDKEYKAHWDEIKKVSDDCDKRQKRLEKLTAEEIEQEIQALESQRLCTALSGLPQPPTA